MEERRSTVMQIAQHLFLEKGFYQTSIQDIIQAANISKGTFYNYFSSKNDCLLAILTRAQKEAFSRRAELYRQAKEDTLNLFAKQIYIRMQVDKEENLLPLFSFVFHTEAEELRSFAKTYHLEEIAWLSQRFLQLYGPKMEPYAVDSAIFVLGLIQQYSLVWSFYAEEEIDIQALIYFILEAIDSYIRYLSEEKRSFVPTELHQRVKEVWAVYGKGDSRLYRLLKEFYEKNKEDPKVAQFIEFLQEEDRRHQPRSFIVQSLCQALGTSYSDDRLFKQIKKECKKQFHF